MIDEQNVWYKPHNFNKNRILMSVAKQHACLNWLDSYNWEYHTYYVARSDVFILLIKPEGNEFDNLSITAHI